jgi:hypothetical protein
VLLHLRDEDCLAADRIAEALKDIGWPHASRSLVLREGAGYLTDVLKGKSQDEILNFFVERARRAHRRKNPPSAA